MLDPRRALEMSFQQRRDMRTFVAKCIRGDPSLPELARELDLSDCPEMLEELHLADELAVEDQVVASPMTEALQVLHRISSAR